MIRIDKYLKKNKLKRFLKSCSICVNLCLITLVLITFTVLNSFAEDRGKKEFWLNKYGEIKEDMHSIRAYKVFNRVLDAADRRTGVEPALYIINFDGLPWAQSLADGSVILTKNGLEFFYKDQGTEKGDYLASMDYMIELPVKPQNNHPLSKRLKPGTEAALNGDYKTVDETMTKDKNRLRILKLTDEKVIVLQKDKIIRLVAYKEPDNMQINTKGGDSREVTISKERRSGTISLGERILYYFEF